MLEISTVRTLVGNLIAFKAVFSHQMLQWSHHFKAEFCSFQFHSKASSLPNSRENPAKDHLPRLTLSGQLPIICPSAIFEQPRGKGETRLDYPERCGRVTSWSHISSLPHQSLLGNCSWRGCCCPLGFSSLQSHSQSTLQFYFMYYALFPTGLRRYLSCRVQHLLYKQMKKSCIKVIQNEIYIDCIWFLLLRKVWWDICVPVIRKSSFYVRPLFWLFESILSGVDPPCHHQFTCCADLDWSWSLVFQVKRSRLKIKDQDQWSFFILI